MREDHVIFTSSVDDGYIAFGKKNGDESYTVKRQSIGRKYSHPGGIQTIGDWVVVPVEGGGTSEIRFYKYKDQREDRQEKRLRICRNKTLGQAGSVGIANYKRKQEERYLLATIPEEKKDGEQEVHFYWTQANMPLSDPHCSFQRPKVWKLSKQCNAFQSKWRDYIDSISLVADEAGNVFLIGMDHDKEAKKDYADLYQIHINVNDNEEDVELTFLESFEFAIPEPECFKDSERSIFKLQPSFRWGGGVLVISRNTVKVFACAHDLLIGNRVGVSIFSAD